MKTAPVSGIIFVLFLLLLAALHALPFIFDFEGKLQEGTLTVSDFSALDDHEKDAAYATVFENFQRVSDAFRHTLSASQSFALILVVISGWNWRLAWRLRQKATAAKDSSRAETSS